MKVRSVNIGSFGKFRDYSITDIPDGLILITGNNESGKTTLMEFMRSTMFPSSKRNVYPTPYQTDKGSIRLETESGDIIVLNREQRKVSELSDLSTEEIFSVDPDTYNTIFAMSLEDLTNSDTISSESIRNRFLTIPGGEKVPVVIKELTSARKDIIGESRRTQQDLAVKLKTELQGLDSDTIRLKQNRSEYDENVKEEEDLKKRIHEAQIAQAGTEKERGRRNNLESQRENVKRIFDLGEKRKGVEYVTSLSNDDIMRYDMLEKSISDLNEEITKIGEAEPLPNDELIKLTTAEKELTMFLSDRLASSDRIEWLKDKIAEDGDRLEEMGISGEGGSPEECAELLRISRKSSPLVPVSLIIVSALMFSLGYLFDSSLMILAGVLIVIIAIIILIRGRNDRAISEWLTSHGHANMERSRIPQFVVKLSKAYEINVRMKYNMSELAEFGERTTKITADTAAVLGRVFRDLNDALPVLKEKMNENDTERKKAETISEKKSLIALKEKEMSDIDVTYGGKEGFKKAREDRSILSSTDIEIDTLVSSVISSTGMDVDSALREMNSVRADGPDMKEEIGEMNRQIGKLNSEMKAILSDGSLNVLSMKRNAKEEELRKKVKEWGVLSLQGTMIDKACDELYRTMQPSVIETANRYLALMTDSRYTIDPDPRRDGIIIFDDKEHKTSKQWSSGLGDQVYLSIKMAVAKEMGKERLPMILDDVLVRFDGKRRRSACQAILDFAKDQQVFLFSCIPIEGAFPEGSFKHISL